MSRIELVERATCHASSVAIVSEGKSYTYDELLVSSANVAAGLLGDQQDLAMARIGFLVPPGFTYAACQWGIWRAGGIAVPLGLQHPLPELQHVVEDAGISILVAHPAWEDKLQPLAAAGSLPLLSLDQLLLEESTSLPAEAMTRPPS